MTLTWSGRCAPAWGWPKTRSSTPSLLAQNAEFGRRIWRPYRQEGAFDFADPGYLREGVDRFVALARKGLGAWLPMNAFIARWYLGMSAMLYRLRARVDLRSIYLRERPRPDGALRDGFRGRPSRS